MNPSLAGAVWPAQIFFSLSLFLFSRVFSPLWTSSSFSIEHRWFMYTQACFNFPFACFSCPALARAAHSAQSPQKKIVKNCEKIEGTKSTRQAVADDLAQTLMKLSDAGPVNN
jgi:hypothetical protein